ncbi:L,D-transpeptidase family protein [Tsuneonella sp. CC-YZS046]|uniref:L,D-transpeptidase family protein n=1 Tax=Tsuneonella sp. CC-YZS046 TaxID=3042152 RepID=UPI002D7823C6|nr:L,D-transpeptidase family protein [Tsuneonella sp. CC-YZS046]WRO65435.1 L,D-transpeptidase family protein [Tsuneonella sp. CC-YZS046]
MNIVWKVIGAVTGAVLLFFGSAAVTGHILEQKGGERTSAQSPRPESEPVLAMADQDLAGANGVQAGETPSDASDASPSALVANDAGAPPAIAEPLVIKSILPIQGPIKYGEWHWDESAAPATGKIVVTVDLDARVISVFRDGHEIGAAAVLLGTDDYPTPLGKFPILQKRKDHVSNIYGAEMPYMMRLTWDGISIHGAEVENGYASHGCIGTPNAFAAKLFAIAKLGDEILISRGKMIGVGDNLAAS